jgi:hypothetical protein
MSLHNTILSFEKNQRFLFYFGALIPNLFPARQVPEIIFNESSKNTDDSLISFGSKSEPKVFFVHQSICGLFGFESSFQNCFWDLFNHLWLVLNLLNKKCLQTFKSVLKEYCDLKLCKDFLDFKNNIFEKKLPNKFKNSNEKFLPLKVSL